jgi:thiosulfate/3-mercaptopyruvate sulfurtransferase
MRRAAVTLLATIVFTPCLAAQTQDRGEGRVRHHQEYLVSTEWLAARLQAPDVVVVEVGPTDASYRQAHIPGARFLPLAAVATTINGLPNEFPPAADLVAAFRALGVGTRARIVLYGDDPGRMAARAWVALDLLGQSSRASLLDGGLARWVAERRPVEQAAAAVEPRPFTARLRADRVVTGAWVRERLGRASVLLVDARPAEEYAGAGHIAGATSIYWMNTLASAADPVLRPMHELHEGIFKPAGADRPAVRTLVVYCHSGMQASFDYFVARYIGYPDVRLYDGSMAEWMQRGYPVETTPQ